MSKQLVVLVGPPGAGKSTLAKTFAEDGFTYVNQDKQSKQHLALFESAIAFGEDVIVDRMNFSKGQRARYLDMAKKKGYHTRIIVLHESYQTCFQRCKERVGHETIQDEASARSALNMFFSKYERPADEEADEVSFIYPEGPKPLAVICDLDGTLCNVDHRLHHVRKEGKKDWHGFFKGMVDDTPNDWCGDLLWGISTSHQVVYCSGRPDSWRPQTVEWLEKHHFWSLSRDFSGAQHLYMRPRSDSRQDSIVKEIILDFELLTRFTPHFMIDDRAQVTEMWRRRGFVCLQCHKGDF